MQHFQLQLKTRKAEMKQLMRNYFLKIWQSYATENLFFQKATGSNACMHLELVASLQDQPEHHASVRNIVQDRDTLQTFHYLLQRSFL
jgi:hypothetical protein